MFIEGVLPITAFQGQCYVAGVIHIHLHINRLEEIQHKSIWLTLAISPI